MGYTHYWYRPLELEPGAWSALVEDAKRLLDAVRAQGLRLVDASGGPPSADDVGVEFNGVGEEACELFRLSAVFPEPRRLRPDGSYFDFCKTAKRPYDLAVTACLLAAKRRFGAELTVCTDGADSDWQAARELCKAVLGYGQEYEIRDRHLVSRQETHSMANVGPIILREFPSVGKYRIRLLRTSASPRARVVLDVREYATGSVEGYTRRGVVLRSCAEVKLLRAALEAVVSEKLLAK